MSDDVPSPVQIALSDVRETFLIWERLRILYNAVLVALTCLVVFSLKPEAATEPHFWSRTILGALAANVCFFAGPAADCYIRWLGYKSRVVTYGILGMGLLVACGITVSALF